jgi:glycosyltransferase involved in cell wall biosynthesis
MSEQQQFKGRLLKLLGEVPPFKWASNWVLGSSATIFMFHRILPRGADCFESELCTWEDNFSDFLDWLQEIYRVVPLQEVGSCIGNSSDQKHPVCAITFDDGWYDNFAYAFPQLSRRKLSATIFLPTRFIGTNRRFWQEHLWLCVQKLKGMENGGAALGRAMRRSPWFPSLGDDFRSYPALKRVLLTRPLSDAEGFIERLVDEAGLGQAFPDRAFMNWDEVKQMQSAGILFGSHTLNHALLPNASPRVADREIRDSREELTASVRDDVDSFSYPWGRLGASSLRQVRESGYKFAVTTKPGAVTRSSDRLLLPRIAVSNAVLDGGQRTFAGGKARISFAKNILTGSIKHLSAKANGNDRIKIIFLLDLITEWEGGTERQLRLLIQSLDLKYFEPKLCFLFEAPELDKASLPCPLRVVCAHSQPIPSALTRLRRLMQILKEERPDIVQCFFIEGLMVGIPAGRLANVAQVVGSVRNAGHWRKRKHRLVMKAITPLAHRWQTNSRALWELQRDQEGVAPDLIEILPNALDLAGFEPATPMARQQARKKLGLNEDGPICISVANLSKVKDLATLVNAAKLLKQRLRSIQFLIVGDGPLRESLEKQAASLGVAENVLFQGRQADVRPFLAAADLGVLTSHSEGSSNSVLEYMAFGLPVVVSDIPPNRELLGGVFFDPGNAADFAEKIFQLWSDIGSQAYNSHYHRRDLEEFSLARMTLRAESFYSRMAAPRETW